MLHAYIHSATIYALQQSHRGYINHENQSYIIFLRSYGLRSDVAGHADVTAAKMATMLQYHSLLTRERTVTFPEQLVIFMTPYFLANG